MNNKKISLFVLAVCFITSNSILAQKTKIRTVANSFGGDEVNIQTAQHNIDQAYEHPDTRNSVDMWCWRGIVYSYICSSPDSSITGMDKDATFKAGESFAKYYGFPESDRETYKEDANRYYAYAAAMCFNQGIILSATKGNLSLVKQYMGFAEVIQKNDVAGQLAEQNLTIPKIYAVILQSAQVDNNQAEEIVYLNKLIDIPNYNNAYVFVRLSEIYSANKDYDKALEVLAKGKDKIPAKASDFLNAEIALEIDRNNIASLINKYNEAIALNPEDDIYYYNRGTTYSMLKNKEVADKVEPPKYFFIQGLKDFNKCLELNPGNGDASFNLASLMVDSANFVYKLISKNPAYEGLSRKLYKDALGKLETIRQSGSRSGSDLVDMLKTMKSICSKLGDEENRKMYNKLYLEEESKLKNAN